MKSKMKRTLALFLTMLMLLTSNSSITTVFASAGNGEAESEATAETESTSVSADGGETETTLTPTPEATATPMPEAEPTQAADNSAGSGAQTRESTRTFNIEASINESGVTEATIQSGDTFTYIIGYTVPPTSGGENYSSVYIEIPLTGELQDRISVVTDETGIGGLSIRGEDIQTAYVRNDVLRINLNQTLTTGTGRRI